ncbi:MAG TPA: PEP-CTERM sorting domain-containing protein [Thermoguttaceae bacterium]|nr:PEP-CTERM sorting domain-containing protein [Thermoguttaceae bacterium]
MTLLTRSLAFGVAAGLLVSTADAGLVLRYNFDDSTATDLSGNSNHGTVGINIFFTTDTPFGSGLAPGTSSNPSGGDPTRVIAVPTSATLEAIDDHLSISFWMKSNASDNNNWVRIFQHGTEGNDDRTWLVNRYSNTSDVNVRVDTVAGAGGQYNQNIAMGGTAAFDGQWHHVFYTLSNGQYWEYVDGKLSTSGTYKHGDGLSNTRPLYIFGQNNDGEYVGLLDDIAIWDDPKGPAWPATIAALADWFGVSLNDPGVAAVASLNILGATAEAGPRAWMYTNQFAPPMGGGSLSAGMHYIGTDTVRYIIFQSDGAGGWLGVRDLPEPSTWALALAGLAALAGWHFASSRRCRGQ